jgi:hypothetical protein
MSDDDVTSNREEHIPRQARPISECVERLDYAIEEYVDIKATLKQEVEDGFTSVADAERILKQGEEHIENLTKGYLEAAKRERLNLEERSTLSSGEYGSWTKVLLAALLVVVFAILAVAVVNKGSGDYEPVD